MLVESDGRFELRLATVGGGEERDWVVEEVGTGLPRRNLRKRHSVLTRSSIESLQRE